METATENNNENQTKLYQSKYPFTLDGVCSSRHLNSKAEAAGGEMIP